MYQRAVWLIALNRNVLLRDRLAKNKKASLWNVSQVKAEIEIDMGERKRIKKIIE